MEQLPLQLSWLPKSLIAFSLMHSKRGPAYVVVKRPTNLDCLAICTGRRSTLHPVLAICLTIFARMDRSFSAQSCMHGVVSRTHNLVTQICNGSRKWFVGHQYFWLQIRVDRSFYFSGVYLVAAYINQRHVFWGPPSGGSESWKWCREPKLISGKPIRRAPARCFTSCHAIVDLLFTIHSLDD